MQGTWCMIPNIVLQDNRLTANAKILFGMIVTISGQRGFCVYDNKELSKEMQGLDTRTIQRYIGQLEACGYIAIDNSRGKRDIHMRLDGGFVVATKPVAGTPEKPNQDHVANGLIEFWASELEKASKHYRVPYRKRTATRGRMVKVNARLKDGLEVALIMHAIKGCVWSDFHCKGGYTDITYICRNSEKVEELALRYDMNKHERKKREDNEIPEFTG